MYEVIALQPHDEIHFLDHIGVICDLLQGKTLFTEEAAIEQASRFYPWLKTELVSFHDLTPRSLYERANLLLYTNFCCTQMQEYFGDFQKQAPKLFRTLCCPHGNSDKGHSSYYMEDFAYEDMTLVYGQRMLDFFQEKQVTLRYPIMCGNYRFLFYQQRQAFFDAFFKQEVLDQFQDPSKPLILYAPTWDDGENGTSFFSASHILINQLPSDFNLLIKCHPRLTSHSMAQLIQFADAMPKQGNVVMVQNYPHVYPLLSSACCFVGDMSSMGYDFLTFNRPLYFLNHRSLDLKNRKDLPLYQCGRVLMPEQFNSLYRLIENDLQNELDCYKNIREKMYEHTFTPLSDLQLLKQSIENQLSIYAAH